MIADYLPELLLALSIQATGILSPGPSVALILGIAASQGRAPALITAVGVGTGSIVLALATVIGITALFAQMAELMTLVRYIGAAYLLWLAWGAFRKALNPPPLKIEAVAGRSARKLALTGFLLQITNPKAILFWLAIASVANIGGAPVEVSALLVLGAFVNSVAGHSLWALVLSAPPIRRGYLGARRPVEAVLGSFFAFAAYKIATERG